MSDDMDIVKGTDNPFRDAELSEPDTKLMKADLAAEIVRILREQNLTGAKAARIADVQEADISRIRNAQLGRFTIDRLVTILGRLDCSVQVHVTVTPGSVRGSSPVLGAE